MVQSHILKRSTALTGIAAASLALALMLSCGSETNPWLSPSVSDVALACPYSDGDTVEVFSTFELKATLLVKEHIASIHLLVPANRKWRSDDTVVSSSEFGPGSALPFQVSFMDTGKQEIVLTAFLTNNDTTKASMSLYCISPLNQANIVGEIGDSLILRTMPVLDEPVIYTWEIGGQRFLNDQPEVTSGILTASFANVYVGRLYVQSLGYSSPAQSFAVSLGDGTPPMIILANDSTNGSHIYSGAVPFPLKVIVTDPSSGVASVSINGGAFDRIDTLGDSVTLAHRFSSLLPYGDSLMAIIQASDAKGNEIVDTVWIHYDSSLAHLDRPKLNLIAPSTNPAIVGTRNFVVQGVVENNDFVDTVYVWAKLNDSTYAPPAVITASGEAWNVDVYLDSDTNALRLTLLDSTVGFVDTLVDTQFVIIYDPEARDIRAPSILAYDFDATYENNKYYTSVSPLDIEVAVIDEQSGVKTVTIGGIAAVRQTGGKYLAAVALAHVSYGNRIAVAVADNAGNIARDTLEIYRNGVPVINAMPRYGSVIAGETLVDSVGATDPDGDPLLISVKIATAKGEQLINADAVGRFSWTPELADTGARQVKVLVNDSYQTAVKTYTIVVVAPGNAAPDTVNFVTTEAQFPDSLVAGKDSLKLTLRVDHPETNGTILYTARIVGGDTLLNDTRDSVLKWSPTLAVVGTQQFVITVRAASGIGDTLRPSIRVVAPPPPVVVAFAQIGSSAPESVSPRNVAVVLSRASDQTIGVDFGVNSFASTADSLDYSLPDDTTLVFAAGDTVAYIVVTVYDDSIVENQEKVILKLLRIHGEAVFGNQLTHTLVIENDDVAPTTYRVAFASSDTTVNETAGDIPVAVSLVPPAEEELKVTIGVRGTATYGTDYTIAPQTVVFKKGESAQTVTVSVINDNECERWDEKVELYFADLDPLMVVDSSKEDSTYVLTILAGDLSYCKPLYMMVHGYSNKVLQRVDQRIVDSLKSWGFDVITVSTRETWTWDNTYLGEFDGVFISRTASDPGVGTYFADLEVPVLCASMENYRSMGLTSAEGTMLNRLFNFPDQNTIFPDSYEGENRWVLNNMDDLPGGQPNQFATILAYLPISFSGSGSATGTDGLTGGNLPAVFTYDPGDISVNGTEFEARRAVYSMLNEGSDGTGDNYNRRWWELLHILADWVAGQ